ncbi:helix-turn-helix domain-containing protein [Bacteroides timonensis]|uniref:helix-turn-helix domain-containing protein n=1 Tax=Bacteroides timonensis TaxID=1470345 RepID=UPI0004BBF527|nr:helix-turn-helix transcriptional regulator [Bacteroides timonensis]
MNATQRIKKVVNWLIFQEIADNERDLADKLGYTKSSFSQIVNGKVPLSEKFVKKLCALDENINEVWVSEGAGTMFKNNLNSENGVSIPTSVWGVIQQQAESLSARDRQVDELIGMLKDQIQEYKKVAAQMGERVISAAAE